MKLLDEQVTTHEAVVRVKHEHKPIAKVIAKLLALLTRGQAHYDSCALENYLVGPASRLVNGQISWAGRYGNDVFSWLTFGGDSLRVTNTWFDLTGILPVGTSITGMQLFAVAKPCWLDGTNRVICYILAAILDDEGNAGYVQLMGRVTRFRHYPANTDLEGVDNDFFRVYHEALGHIVSPGQFRTVRRADSLIHVYRVAIQRGGAAPMAELQVARFMRSMTGEMRSDEVVLQHNVFTFSQVKRAANPQMLGGYGSALAMALDGQRGGDEAVTTHVDPKTGDAAIHAEKRARTAEARAEAQKVSNEEVVGEGKSLGSQKQQETALEAQGGTFGAKPGPGGGAQAVDLTGAVAQGPQAGEGLDGEVLTEAELAEAVVAEAWGGEKKPDDAGKDKKKV